MSLDGSMAEEGGIHIESHVIHLQLVKNLF